MRCKNCLSAEWETILKFIKEIKADITSKTKFYHLYQCKSCKRIVVATYNQFYSSGKA